MVRVRAGGCRALLATAPPCLLATAPPCLLPSARPPAVLQLFLSPLLLWESFLANALSVALYGAALAHYHYMNFLGYSALPFLEHTEVRLALSLACGPCVEPAA